MMTTKSIDIQSEVEDTSDPSEPEYDESSDDDSDAGEGKTYEQDNEK